ncbi:hypothetical protein A2348_05370 [Candidatus Uhrbacteria bacterium RIFOXYB12_FULL_58_10]|uniref:Uncharacterized protein n=1 Tax=Candidatus Uhrbacteria bacterium RIFOXYB2_FULL_57_15 TaxID=1802422 RepID=A0A1F7W806_9BACT|nr:MAG: hypothetical protein A2348_05370 [Candidatus Uhrbacteria bacterium RIFOXYB12_FULL_58_10]OGL98910.1 MAG: hypothetical protein A2304_04125 [Candidatus Uhrbacteria bacterium RIFOXYB2_FULL_57_15]OGM00053.1 MAG: hypothetical protein A2501_03835 [Candidatus Uhrbacteria bacterium RIFOXYC12_FULL_57_11]
MFQSAFLSLFKDEEILLFSMLVRQQPRLVILVAQVDPDGIGSALGLAAIACHLGVEASIFYAGSFGHPQMIMLWEAFGLAGRICPVEAIDPGFPVALVDSSKTSDARFGERSLDPAIVIDHHGDAREVRMDRFHCVVPVGAASSLVACLGARLGVTFGRDVSTLLAMGIHTDTDGLTYVGTRPIDRYAYAWLMDTGDQELVHRISRFPMSERACTIVQRLLTHRSMYRGNILLSHPPSALEPTEGEYLAFAADILVRHEDARLVLALGVVGDHVRVSARTREPALPLPRILVHLFGPNSGAKECSGGALLDFPDGPRVGQRREDKFNEFLACLEGRLADLDLPS